MVVLNWFESQLTTGFIEGMNGLIQAAKSKARGYRSDRKILSILEVCTKQLFTDLILRGLH